MISCLFEILPNFFRKQCYITVLTTLIQFQNKKNIYCNFMLLNEFVDPATRHCPDSFLPLAKQHSETKHDTCSGGTRYITIHMPQKWILSSSLKCFFRKTSANVILVRLCVHRAF